MSLLADALLLIAALSAAVYCRILATRLRRLGDTGKGLGGAISTLALQVDEMKAALGGLQDDSEQQAARLDSASTRAEAAARRLELLLAALPDEAFPGPAATDSAAPPGRASDSRPGRLPLLKLSPADRLHPAAEAKTGAAGTEAAGGRRRGPARRIFRSRAVGGVGVSA